MVEEQPIIWITGQPGAGKSTLGRALLDDLKSKGHPVFLVDGDDLRALTANADYSPAGREANIRRAQDIALYLSRQGQVAIVAVVAPFLWLREEFKKNTLSLRLALQPALHQAAVQACVLPGK